MLGVEEFLEILIDDPHVNAIALYIEGLRDVPRFAEAALRALKAGVPIIAQKVGTSEIGARLTVSHTGSLSGANELYQALFDRVGVISVDSTVAMLETLKLVTIAGVPQGRRIAAFTCSGGDSIMLADGGGALGLSFPQPSPNICETLEALLPKIATVSNPLDYTTPLWGQEAPLREVLTVALKDRYDLALMVQDYPASISDQACEPYRADARAFMTACKAAAIPGAVCSILPETLDAKSRDTLATGDVAPLQGIADALGAIARAGRLGELQGKLAATGEAETLQLWPRLPEPVSVETLTEHEGKQRLAQFGVPAPAGRVVGATDAPAAAQELGFPVVVKVLSKDLPHKTEVGAVQVGLKDEAEVSSAVERMVVALAEQAPHVRPETFLVEEMVERPLAELIVGIQRDPAFGLALVIGSGGTLVELVGDSVTLLLPNDQEAIEQALDSLKVAALLTGHRGAGGRARPRAPSRPSWAPALRRRMKSIRRVCRDRHDPEALFPDSTRRTGYPGRSSGIGCFTTAGRPGVPWRRKRLRRSHAAFVAACSWLAGCQADLDVPPTAQLICERDRHCPPSYRCVQERCVSVDANFAPQITVLTIERAVDRITIPLDVSDAESDPVTVRAAFRVGDTGPFVPTTLVDPEVRSSPGGESVQLAWDARAPLESAGHTGWVPQVTLRLTPQDGHENSRDAGEDPSVETNPFAVGNDPPVVADVSVTDAVVAGVAVIQLTVSDRASDPVALSLLEVSRLGDFTDAVAVSLTEGPATPFPGGGVSDLDTSPTGVTHSIAWDSRFGADYDAAAVGVRLRVIDALGAESNLAPAASLFATDNQTPPRVLDATARRAQLTDGSAPVAIHYRLADAESDAADLRPEYSTDAGVSWTICNELAVPLSEGRYDLATTPAGIDGDGGLWHTYVWDPAGVILVPGETRLRVAASDGKNTAVEAVEVDLPRRVTPAVPAYGAEQPWVTGLEPRAVVAADFDRDGFADLAVANAGADTVSILLNAGDGALGAPNDVAAGVAPLALVAADFTSDGVPDLAVLRGGDGRITILRGLGDGTFAVQGLLAAGSQPMALATADLDGDGARDLAVADPGAGAVQILILASALLLMMGVRNMASLRRATVRGAGHAQGCAA